MSSGHQTGNNRKNHRHASVLVQTLTTLFKKKNFTGLLPTTEFLRIKNKKSFFVSFVYISTIYSKARFQFFFVLVWIKKGIFTSQNMDFMRENSNILLSEKGEFFARKFK